MIYLIYIYNFNKNGKNCGRKNIWCAKSEVIFSTLNAYCMKLRGPGQKLLLISKDISFIIKMVWSLFLIISKEKPKTVAGKDSGVTNLISNLRLWMCIAWNCRFLVKLFLLIFKYCLLPHGHVLQCYLQVHSTCIIPEAFYCLLKIFVILKSSTPICMMFLRDVLWR